MPQTEMLKEFHLVVEKGCLLQRLSATSFKLILNLKEFNYWLEKKEK